MKTVQQLSSLVMFTMLIICGFTSEARAENSGEMSCRMKAKEIAAETYKNCMTDQRQTQLEQIRKDYKEKLSELKSHYDEKLKKLSGVSGKAQSAPAVSEQPQSSDEMSKPVLRPLAEAKRSAQNRSRASGARSLPMKKGPVKSQSIDLSTPSMPSDSTAVESVQAENRLKIEQDGPNDIEVVELPSQE
ncbi:MAG: hypothetical protein H7061_08465 [Bdellovibrionaceae bacterium]|nr:hypothetical protein [Bdellovibrio sp.]